jgi:hypothetical protein
MQTCTVLYSLHLMVNCMKFKDGLKFIFFNMYGVIHTSVTMLCYYRRGYRPSIIQFLCPSCLFNGKQWERAREREGEKERKGCSEYSSEGPRGTYHIIARSWFQTRVCVPPHPLTPSVFLCSGSCLAAWLEGDRWTATRPTFLIWWIQNYAYESRFSVCLCVATITIQWTL